ncbi:MAG TPA: sirohydrochlorin chelatase, partial [Candidatus Udaeobacter sp.]|nr:sirohydrochlorin chelatase [Candidatus Udaeobacter sp.]
MEAILLVGHGSRDPEGNAELLRFADMVRQKAPQYVIETCFLEFEAPNISKGIDRCVELGAHRIVVVPITLFAAGHAKVHIPLEICNGKKRYPHIEFTYGRPIGVHHKVIEILQSRLEEAGFPAETEAAQVSLPAGGGCGKAAILRNGETAVLVLGRGSSDAEANGDLFKMTRLLWEQVPVKWVESSFIGVTEPSFPEGLERCLRLGAKKIYVLPYFLFTGILIKRIEQMTAEFAATHKEIDIQLAGYFGFHPLLVEVLLDRVTEAIEGEPFVSCDMCRAGHSHDHDHHHHHHHHDHSHDHSHDHHY